MPLDHSWVAKVVDDTHNPFIIGGAPMGDQEMGDRLSGIDLCTDGWSRSAKSSVTSITAAAPLPMRRFRLQMRKVEFHEAALKALVFTL
jgi:hypothetical protein